MSIKKNSLPPPWEEIGQRFKLARGSRPVTDISALSGVSDSAIARCEKGQQAPSLELLAYYSLRENIPMELIVFSVRPSEDGMVALRLQGLALPPHQRVALARELIADLERSAT
jgi:transcriptional regulator with XRE-family HTH domain